MIRKFFLLCAVIFAVLSCSCIPAKSAVEFTARVNAIADEVVAQLDVVVQALPADAKAVLPYWAQLKASVKQVETAMLDGSKTIDDLIAIVTSATDFVEGKVGSACSGGPCATGKEADIALSQAENGLARLRGARR